MLSKIGACLYLFIERLLDLFILNRAVCVLLFVFFIYRIQIRLELPMFTRNN